MQKRYTALDGLRGVAAMEVVLGHFQSDTGPLGWPIFNHGYLCVDLFFVLSGFVITHAYPDAGTRSGRFLWRRVGRLWPLHIVMLVAFVAFEIIRGRLLGGMFTGERTLAALPSNALFLDGAGLLVRPSWNFPSWSISVEMICYVLFAIFMAAGRRLAVAGGLIIAALIVQAWVGRLHPDSPSAALGLWRSIAGFFCGHLIYRLRAKIPRSNGPGAELIAAMVAILLICVPVDGRLTMLMAPLLFSTVVYVFADSRGPVSSFLNSRIIQHIGLISYSIYMVHALILACVLGLERVTHAIPGIRLSLDLQYEGNWVVVLPFATLVCAAILIVATITQRLIEMPAQRFLLSLDLKKRLSATAS